MEKETHSKPNGQRQERIKEGGETTYFKDKINKKLVTRQPSRGHKTRSTSLGPSGLQRGQLRAALREGDISFLDTARWPHLAGYATKLSDVKADLTLLQGDSEGEDENESPTERAIRQHAEEVADKDIEALKMTIKALRSQLDDQVCSIVEYCSPLPSLT